MKDKRKKRKYVQEKGKGQHSEKKKGIENTNWRYTTKT